MNVIAHKHYGNNTFLHLKCTDQGLSAFEMQEHMEDIYTFVILLPVKFKGKITHLLFSKDWKQLALVNEEYALVPYTVTVKYPVNDEVRDSGD